MRQQLSNMMTAHWPKHTESERPMDEVLIDWMNTVIAQRYKSLIEKNLKSV